ncbi:unnamed protein product [Urochloa decumbens]|uniref:CRAL-TRIO domain-containing protein n=1 Tax=Urochloa decumbens TaxID=240449 RepID=A0ABC9E2S3_9POAL
MGDAACEDAVEQLAGLLDKVDAPLKKAFENVHQGYPTETLIRFLKAREWHVNKAQKMLVESLNWRIQNEIDSILEKPIIPEDLYRSIRDTQLVGLSGYSKEGIPVFAVGVGLSTYDKASVNYYVQSHIQINEYRDRFILPMVTKKYGGPITTCIKVLDMTGLKLSALNQMKIVTAISTVDDLNYPEKTETYYIVNTPYIFSACWKPLLQERTRKKVHVLRGCGKDELLKVRLPVSTIFFSKCYSLSTKSNKIIRRLKIRVDSRAFLTLPITIPLALLILEQCRSWTTLPFPTSVDGRARVHLNIHQATPMTASLLTTPSTKSSTTSSRSKR